MCNSLMHPIRLCMHASMGEINNSYIASCEMARLQQTTGLALPRWCLFHFITSQRYLLSLQWLLASHGPFLLSLTRQRLLNKEVKTSCAYFHTCLCKRCYQVTTHLLK